MGNTYNRCTFFRPHKGEEASGEFDQGENDIPLAQVW
jgi:hypothetical protein